MSDETGIRRLSGAPEAVALEFLDERDELSAEGWARRVGYFQGRGGRCLHLLGPSPAEGRLSALIPREPALSGVGYLGFPRTPQDPRLGDALMAAAMAWFQEQGVAELRAPVDLSTWYRNRVNLGPLERPLFAGELAPDEGLAHWLRRAGFSIIWRYLSAEEPGLPELARISVQRIRDSEAKGLSLRSFERAHAARDLERLHRLSLACFAGNYSFSPIGLQEFRELYGPVLDRLPTDTLLFGLDEQGEEAGFIFAYPDPTNPEVLVVKSLGVLPAQRRRGLGDFLYAGLQQRAVALGCRTAIHALMNQASGSRAISARRARVFRHYGMFGRSGFSR